MDGSHGIVMLRVDLGDLHCRNTVGWFRVLGNLSLMVLMIFVISVHSPIWSGVGLAIWNVELADVNAVESRCYGYVVSTAYVSLIADGMVDA